MRINSERNINTDTLSSEAHLQLALMRLYEGEPRGRSQKLYTRNLHQTAWLVKSGRARVQQETGVVEATEGEWIFPKPAPRYQEFEKNTRILSIGIRAEWPDGRNLFDKGLTAVFSALKFPALLRRTESLMSAWALPSGLERHLALQAAVFTWMRAAHEALTSQGIRADERPFRDCREEKILHALNAWPLQKPYSAGELSRALGLSRAHFERLCTTFLRKTPKRYLDERRLSLARQLLPQKSVKEVACEIGFSHTSTFSAWFKHQLGHSPSEAPKQLPIFSTLS